jgi:glucosyl-dolichyl phosphate glucuronosyltransferase
MNVSTISIVICTYNRASLLRETLTAMQRMTPPSDCDVEIVVVDNNSRDETPSVVAQCAAAGPFRVVSLAAKQQGKSFALNAGLAHARGDVLALTDDDVVPSADWLVRIVDDFRAHDVTFVFGKVLPRWAVLPPPEMLTEEAQKIWGALAIVDYGDEPADYRSHSTSQRLPIGANLAFARTALETIGGWRTDLGKVNNTLVSGEDHEIFMRLRRYDLYAGYYDPEITVRHLVPRERLTRKYFRRWFFWHGKTQAIMLADLYPELDLEKVPVVGGIPRFLIRQALQELMTWLRRIGHADSLRLLIAEMNAIKYAGLFAQLWRQRHQQPRWRAISMKRPSCGAGFAEAASESVKTS